MRMYRRVSWLENGPGMTVYAIEDEFSRKMEAEKRELADGYIRDYFELLGAKK